MTYLFFNPRSTFSYIYSLFATSLDLHPDLLDMPIRVVTLVGKSVIVVKVYKSFVMNFVERDTYIDLII